MMHKKEMAHLLENSTIPAKPPATNISIILNFLQANVLTLGWKANKGTQEVVDTQGGRNITGRTTMLARQYRRAKMHVICHQEERTPKGQSTVEGYQIFSSGRTKAGSHGCGIWVSTAIPYGYVAKESIRFAHDACKVIYADPTRILAVLKGTGIDFLIVCGHAPIENNVKAL